MYRYQSSLTATSNKKPPTADSPSASKQTNGRECGNTKLHGWALKQYNEFASPDSLPSDRSSRETSDIDSNMKSSAEDLNSNVKVNISKRDVSLTEKYLELGLVISRDMFEKRNNSSRSQVLDDAIQIANCLDLYFRHSVNTRISLTYVETWAYSDQIEISDAVKQTLYNFLEYSTRRLYMISMDAVHLITGGHSSRFFNNELGMSIPDSICTSRAVSVSQEGSIHEPFVAASVMAHMIGHNLGMEHDESEPASSTEFSPDTSDSSTNSNKMGVSSSLQPKGLNEPRPSAPSKLSPQQQQQQQHKDDDNVEEEMRGSRSPTWSSIDLNEPSMGVEQTNPRILCESNCLMTERFLHLQSPITIGHLTNSNRLSDFGPELAGQQRDGDIENFFDYEESNQNDKDRARSSPIQSGYRSLPFKFSKKSIDTYHRLLRLGRGICLFNRPNQIEDFKLCGNGILDKGEDCDCGNFQECRNLGDSCCDPITCRYRADAECVNGTCCEKCRLRPRGYVCRQSRGECDLVEYCDGKSSQCLPDVHMANGHPCSSGYCYMGQCPSSDSQCADIWGQGALQSNLPCFETYNSNGSVRGNCGQVDNSRSSTFKKCEPENVRCGTLQCQGGGMRPLLGGQVDFRRFAHNVDGSQLECKSISGHPIAYVRDGSRCAPGKVCLNQICLPLEVAYRETYQLCPQDESGRQCSGNGWCSSAHRCHCDPDWMGHDCSQVWETKRESPKDLGMQLATSAPSMSRLNPTAQQSQTERYVQISTPTNHSSQNQSQFKSTSNITPSNIQVSDQQPREGTTTIAPLSSNVVSDKKKHDALGARYLVIILVTSVAAVYIGFALMANCYRRKNFYKPDKVLRHHQMSCKLESLRTSFIERRLADAKVATVFNNMDSNVFNSTAPLLANDETIDILGSSNVAFSPGLIADHVPTISTAIGNLMSNQTGSHSDPQERRISASVHYTVGDGRTSLLEPDHIPLIPENQQTGQTFRLVPVTDQATAQNTMSNSRRATALSSFSGDGPNSARLNPSSHHQSVITGSGQISSANSSLSTRRWQHQQQQMNRATSLGNFDHGKQRVQQIFFTDPAKAHRRSQTDLYWLGNQSNNFEYSADDDDDDERYGFGRERARTGFMSLGRKSSGNNMLHSVLATPVRFVESRRLGLKSTAVRPPWVDNSTHICDGYSFPSSPDLIHQHRRNLSQQNQQQHQHHHMCTREECPFTPGYRETSILGSRHRSSKQRRATSMSGPANSDPMEASRRLKSTSRHESLEIPDGSSEEDEANKRDIFELPPPPPPLPAEGTESEETEADLNRRHTSSPDATGKTMRSGHSMRMTVAQRIPLNDSVNQLSLIAQLQQLERVRNLHKKQQQLQQHITLDDEDDRESLHEFFSLPLIVQLSALLGQNEAPGESPSKMPIDDFLNNLNNSSVAHSSRKIFKKNVSNISQQQQANTSKVNQQQQQQHESSSSRATVKRQSQQVKLHNLQALINKLQRLQEQATREQRKSIGYDGDDDDVDDCELDLADDCDYPRAPMSNRCSRLSQRVGDNDRSRSISRSSSRLAANRVSYEDRTDRLRPRTRSGREKSVSSSSKGGAESIYSMSDSEDGSSYALSRVVNRLTSAKGLRKNSDNKQDHSEPDDSNSTVLEASGSDTKNPVNTTGLDQADSSAETAGQDLESPKLTST